MRNRIANFGVFLALAGLVSSVLAIVGYELRMLRPLTEAPPLVGWGVRLGLLVVGIAIFMVASRGEQDAPASS
jgi:hypothetical protein